MLNKFKLKLAGICYCNAAPSNVCGVGFTVKVVVLMLQFWRI